MHSPRTFAFALHAAPHSCVTNAGPHGAAGSRVASWEVMRTETTRVGRVLRAWSVTGCMAMACGGASEAPSEGVTVAPQPSASAMGEAEASSAEPRVESTDCGHVLALRSELPKCEQPGCDKVNAQASRTLRWRLVLERFYIDSDGRGFELSNDALAHHAECVLQQLEVLGVSADVTDGGDIEVLASYAQVRPVLHTIAIDSMEVSCSERDCQDCAALSEPQCRADPVCAPMMAQRFEPVPECKTVGYAGCARRDLICGDALTTAISPDGVCWLFSSTCQPDDFVDRDGTMPCDYDQFAGVADCGGS